MIELYLDTADTEQITRLNACLPLRGITTNPSILAQSGIGLNQVLQEVSAIIGSDVRFHAQVISQTVAEIVEEAKQLNDLPYDIVVKVPVTETGLAAIRQIKAEGIKVLATAIYNVQQGFLAALCGADYLAPYVNRIEAMGVDGIGIVADLQLLLDRYGLECKILAASFKNTRQALEVMKLGIGAITLPADIAEQMLVDPAVQPAVDQFTHDWKDVFGDRLSYES